MHATKAAFAFVAYFDIFVNEVTIIENIKWLSIHLYVVQAWKRIPILLCVETIGVLVTFDDIFVLLVEACLDFGGLGFEELAAKVVNMGCDGSNVL
jgi:hypothetical protein